MTSSQNSAPVSSSRAARSDRRALRVLLSANDGVSAGHVTRSLAIAGALSRIAERRGLAVKLLLVTTSDAHSLISDASVCAVRLPNPTSARKGSLEDEERRRIVRNAFDSVCEGFAPDLFVVDTFPSGPHGELAGAARSRAKKALIRRDVLRDRASESALTSGIERFDLAIVADDPTARPCDLPITTVRVPPITLHEASEGLDRRSARQALGLRLERKTILVTSGGGGDPEGVAHGEVVAAIVARIDPSAVVVLARGPIAPRTQSAGYGPRVKVIERAPLQPLLSAFDGAISAAGYNTAHELAKASVPTALFAEPRAFDDQAGRAARFAEAGLACVLQRFTESAIANALAWMTDHAVGPLESGGADRAAEALLDLVTGDAP